MKRIIIIITLFLCIFLKIHSQFNELQILLNQARTHENRNQYTQALEIYENLYAKYPSDESVIESYLRVLYINSDFKKANEILTKSKSNLNPYFYTRQFCLFQIKNNQINDAKQTAFEWLNKNPGSIQHYRDFSRIFESSALFDIAIEIYLKGRNEANDPNLYSLELSNAYYYIKNVQFFFDESIKFLRLNSGYLYYYRNRFKEFISADHNNIKFLKDIIKDNEPEQVLEIFAFSLVEVQDFKKASEIYEKLPLSKLITFADDLKTDNHLDFALDTYNKAIAKADTPAIKADIQLKIAQIYFEQNEIENSKTILSEIINNKEIQKSPWNHRTKANKDARLLMAFISIYEEKNPKETTQWFEAAANFSANLIEKSDIYFQLARYLYLKENYSEAYKTIETAVKGQDVSSNIFKASYFYRYEMALFQNNSAKDSLLTECIIHFPEDPRISDMLFLETFLNQLDSDNKINFLYALRHKGLYQDSLAVRQILSIASTTNIDELYIIAYEWAASTKQYHAMEIIEQHNFKNPIFKDFIFLQKVRTTTDVENKKRMISDFLGNNPQNIFSPHLRYLLFKTNESS